MIPPLLPPELPLAAPLLLPLATPLELPTLPLELPVAPPLELPELVPLEEPLGPPPSSEPDVVGELLPHAIHTSVLATTAAAPNEMFREMRDFMGRTSGRGGDPNTGGLPRRPRRFLMFVSEDELRAA